MKAYEVLKVQFHSLLNSVLGGHEWSTSRNGRHITKETAPYSLNRRSDVSQAKPGVILASLQNVSLL